MQLKFFYKYQIIHHKTIWQIGGKRQIKRNQNEQFSIVRQKHFRAKFQIFETKHSWNKCLYNLGQNILVDKLSKSSKIGFSVKCSKRDFLQFSRATLKTFSSVGQTLGFVSKCFRDFVEIFLFPKILSFELFGKSLSTDKNLVPLNLRLRKTITQEKVCEYLI